MKALTAVASILQAVGFGYVVLVGHRNSEANLQNLQHYAQCAPQRRAAQALSVVVDDEEEEVSRSEILNGASVFVMFSICLSLVALLLCVLLLAGKCFYGARMFDVTVGSVVLLTMCASALCVVGAYHQEEEVIAYTVQYPNNKKNKMHHDGGFDFEVVDYTVKHTNNNDKVHGGVGFEVVNYTVKHTNNNKVRNSVGLEVVNYAVKHTHMSRGIGFLWAAWALQLITVTLLLLML